MANICRRGSRNHNFDPRAGRIFRRVRKPQIHCHTEHYITICTPSRLQLSLRTRLIPECSMHHFRVAMNCAFSPKQLSTRSITAHLFGPMANSDSAGFSVAPGDEIVSDSRCFVCGMGNIGGLRVRFFRQGDDCAIAECKPDKAFTGYDGLLHGGVASSLLDEIMIKAVLAHGKLVVTAKMTVRYHRPILMDSNLNLKGKIVGQRGRIFDTEGVITDSNGQVLTSATGRYVELTAARREQLLRSLGRN